ncbi:MAG: hypothetical protein J6Y62_01780 [Clostridia bacterium]|nr:hypothetical protein [Clostridia bacterium]
MKENMEKEKAFFLAFLEKVKKEGRAEDTWDDPCGASFYMVGRVDWAYDLDCNCHVFYDGREVFSQIFSQSRRFRAGQPPFDTRFDGFRSLILRIRGFVGTMADLGLESTCGGHWDMTLWKAGNFSFVLEADMNDVSLQEVSPSGRMLIVRRPHLGDVRKGAVDLMMGKKGLVGKSFHMLPDWLRADMTEAS